MPAKWKRIHKYLGAFRDNRFRRPRMAKRRLTSEALEDRVLLAADSGLWQNSTDASDVNGDGFVSPIDALIILDELRSSGPRHLMSGSSSEAESESNDPTFYDVSGDDFLTSMDALLVMNQLDATLQGALPDPDKLAAISGTVVIDLTDDGSTIDDTALENITVNLYLDDGDGIFNATDVLQDTMLTDATGGYRFDALGAGTYFVEQEAAAGLLQRAGENVKQVEISAVDASGNIETLIDSFDMTAQSVAAASILGTTMDGSAMAAPEAIGGERDLFVELISTLGEVKLSVNEFGNLLLKFDTSSSSVGKRVVAWDGADGDAATLDATGLGGLDITANGDNLGVLLTIGADQGNGVATLRVYTDANNWSVGSFPIPSTGGLASTSTVMPFSEFITGDGAGVDFTNVGAIELLINGVAAVDGQLDLLGAVQPNVLTANFINLEPLSVGDLVWRDDNDNAVFDSASELGIENVDVNLYIDTDSSGDFTPGVDNSVDSTTTDAGGNYLFGDLFPGEYVIQVDPSNFGMGGPLEGLVSSTPNPVTPDPDDDVNNDDNGDELAGNGVVSLAITLSSGAEPVDDGDSDANSNLTVDFGFVDFYSLGDLVWNDTNNNGLFDSGAESGIENVVVNLYTDDDLSGDFTPGVDQKIADTMTDASGNYLFEGLVLGQYVVQLDPLNFSAGGTLEGLRSSTGNEPTPDPDDLVDNDDNGDPLSGHGIVSQAVNLPSDSVGGNNLTVDFGVFTDYSLGDLVWFDSNNNGVFDAGSESGIFGVVVNLFADTDSSGDYTPGVDIIQDSKTTGGTGSYIFEGLLAGEYIVQIDPSNFNAGGALEGLQTSTGNEPTPDADDLVDNDDNGDALAGNGVVSQVVTLPSSAADGNNPTVDFGFFGLLSLGDLVWNDVNNDGLFDVGSESGIDGVTVNLYADTDSSGDFTPGVDQFLSDTATNVLGNYLFSGLLPGEYIVQIDPANFNAGGSLEGLETSTGNEPTPDADDLVDNDDNGDALAGNGVVSQAVTLPSATGDNNNLTVDFGFFSLQSLGDLVWLDSNNNGQFDAASENGIFGVAVNLYADSDSSGDFTLGVDQIVDFTTTGASGNYLFENLLPGEYVVQIAPANFNAGGALEGLQTSTGNEPTPDADDLVDNDDNGDALAGSGVVSQAVTLPSSAPDGNNLTVDFGFFGLFSIGDLVWNDTNNNGLFDTGSESGINNVLVNLYADTDASGDYTPGTDLLIASDGTDAAGNYLFENLLPGEYVVQIDPANFNAGGILEGLQTSTGNDPASDPDDLINDDDNGTELAGNGVVSQAVTLPSSAADGNNLTVDFGFFQEMFGPLSVGDLVWNDLNNNGIFDSATESGIEGVIVSLFNDDDFSNDFSAGDTPERVTVTDSNGNYLFAEVEEGDYIIVISETNFDAGNPLEGFISSTGITPASDPDDNVNNDDNGEPAIPLVVSLAVTLSFGDEPIDDGDMDPNSNLTVDFGFFASDVTPSLSVGDLVWNDVNNDGIFDSAAESGIQGVSVVLYEDVDSSNDFTAGADIPLEVDITDADGLYLFDDLDPGNYIVLIAQSNFNLGNSLRGLATSTGNDPVPDPDDDVNNDDNGDVFAGPGVVSKAVTLSLGTEPIDDGDTDPNTNLSVDFGFFTPEVDNAASISGFVYLDVDNDGLLEAGEPGIELAEVTLMGTDILGNDVLRTTNTAADGSYGFFNLVPGRYEVVETQPRLFTDGKDTQGTPLLGQVHNDIFAEIDLAGGVHAINYNFGERMPSKRALLASSGDDGVRLILGDRVWNDANNDGEFDVQQESGIGGVVMNIYLDGDASGGFTSGGVDVLLGTTETNDLGEYFFLGLLPGGYIVQADESNFEVGGPLAGFESSTGGGVATDPDDDIDNDDNGERLLGHGAVSQTITVIGGSEPTNDGDNDANTNFTLDFGFFQATNVIGPPEISLSGSQGDENDGQTQQFAWEVTKANPNLIDVSVTRNGTLIFSSNDQTGMFNFDGFGRGDYEIEVTAVDDNGNTTISNRLVEVIDDDPLGPSILQSGSIGTENENETQEFGWEVSDSSGISSVTVRVFQDSVMIFESMDEMGTFNFDSFGTGTFVLEVRATDADLDWFNDARTTMTSRTVTVI